MPGSQPEPSQRAHGAGEAHVDGCRGPERGVEQIEHDLDLGVGAADRSRRTAPHPERVAAEERIEQVAEAERVGGGTTSRARAARRLTEDVVAAAALGVAQRLVRDADLLEALLGRGIARVVVGVVPARLSRGRRA